MNIPECLNYHENSELRSKTGYYPNLSKIQINAIKELEKSLIDYGYSIDESDGEAVLLKLLRFLRARNFNVPKAYEMLKCDLEWRKKEEIKYLKYQQAEEVLKCDLSLVYKYFPTWIQGYDLQNRPIAWRQFGKFEIWNLLKITTMDRLLNFHAWESEQAIRLMLEKSEELNCNIETFMIVIDAAGWSLKLATSQAFQFINGMAVTDSAHYPERLGKLVVINAPSALAIAWRIISTFLDDVQRAKIRILSGPNDWMPVLLENIDISQIPRQYGGNAPDFTADEAISSINPPKISKNSSARNIHNFTSVETHSETIEKIKNPGVEIPVRRAIKSTNELMLDDTSSSDINNTSKSYFSHIIESIIKLDITGYFVPGNYRKISQNCPEILEHSNIDNSQKMFSSNTDHLNSSFRQCENLNDNLHHRPRLIYRDHPKILIDSSTQTFDSSFQKNKFRDDYSDFKKNLETKNSSCIIL